MCLPSMHSHSQTYLCTDTHISTYSHKHIKETLLWRFRDSGVESRVAKSTYTSTDFSARATAVRSYMLGPPSWWPPHPGTGRMLPCRLSNLRKCTEFLPGLFLNPSIKQHSGGYLHLHSFTQSDAGQSYISLQRPHSAA